MRDVNYFIKLATQSKSAVSFPLLPSSSLGAVPAPATPAQSPAQAATPAAPSNVGQPPVAPTATAPQTPPTAPEQPTQTVLPVPEQPTQTVLPVPEQPTQTVLPVSEQPTQTPPTVPVPSQSTPPAVPVPSQQTPPAVPVPSTPRPSDVKPAEPAPGPAAAASKAWSATTAAVNDEAVPLPKKIEAIATDAQTHIDQGLRAGLNDSQANKDTDNAKAFQASTEKGKNAVVQSELDKRVQADPEAAKTPSGFGAMVAQATGAWDKMPQESKWAVGLGVPVAIIGLLTALMGRTGGDMAGGGLLALLGLGAAGFGAANAGMLGDDARRMAGQGAVSLAGLAGKSVPTAAAVTAGLAGKGGQEKVVLDAMNAPNAETKTRGGWAAGQAEIEKSKAQIDGVTSLGPQAGTTAIMGLPGSQQTSQEAGAQYAQLQNKSTELSDPRYLYNQAQDKTMRRLQAADAKPRLLGSGGLTAMLQARERHQKEGPQWSNLVSRGVNSVREGAVLRQMRKDPEAKTYLQPGRAGAPDTLPTGTNMEDFRDNMLMNAYGEYPAAQKAAADKVIYKILAAAAVRRATVRAYA